MVLDITHIIESGGLLLISLIIFAESGLLAGFFLPGDTLLFSAGFFASQHKLPLIGLLILVTLSAIAGYEVGYHIGQRFGPRLFKKKDGLLFRQEYLEKSEKFYEKHGRKTVMLSRFVPVVRTFVPVVAGIGKMDRQKFWTFNIIGAILWGCGVTLIGYFLGRKIPNVDKYILPAIGLATVLTFGPAIYHLAKDKKLRERLFKKS